MNQITRISLLAILCCQFVIGQVESPPNLSLGAQGLLFEKGSIDVELLSELIVSKQDELKQEIIKRGVIKELHQNNFASYAFAYSSLNDLMAITDKKSLSKKLLIYIEDFALVYGFTEFYLQASGKFGNKNLAALLKEIEKQNELNPLASRYFNEGSIKSKKLGVNSDLAWPKFYLKDFAKYSIKIKDGQEVSLTDLLVDFFYAVLKKNSNVSERGFLKIENYGDLSYLYSTYNKFLISGYTDNNAAKNLDTRVTDEIDMLFNYYSLVKGLKEGGYTFREVYANVYSSFTDNEKVFCDTYLKDAFDKLQSNSQNFYKDLKEIDTRSQNYSETTQTKLTNYVESAPKLVAAAEELYQRYQLVQNSSDKDGKLPFYASDLYYINDVAKPALAFLTQFGDLDEKYLENLEQVEKSVTEALVYNAIKDVNKLNAAIEKEFPGATNGSILDTVNISNFLPFIDLIVNLDKFNMAETYNTGLEALGSASELFKDYKAGEYMKILVELLQTYTNVDTSGNKIDINVEEIIVRLYDSFISGKSKKFASFFFTIGINTTLNTEGSERLVDSQGNPVDNLVFAGEKLGVKLNIINFEKNSQDTFAKAVNEGEAPNLEDKVKPIFTDIYFSAYTSGLLYNLVNTTNADEKLGGYMLGTSLGTTFFNNMDFNVFVNFYATKTQDFQFRNSLIGISWDIPIIEYIGALTKKRNKASQN